MKAYVDFSKYRLSMNEVLYWLSSSGLLNNRTCKKVFLKSETEYRGAFGGDRGMGLSGVERSRVVFSSRGGWRFSYGAGSKTVIGLTMGHHGVTLLLGPSRGVDSGPQEGREFDLAYGQISRYSVPALHPDLEPFFPRVVW